jgi:hypothetical protein
METYSRICKHSNLIIMKLLNCIPGIRWLNLLRPNEHLEAEYKIKMAKQNNLFDRSNLYEFYLPSSLFNLPTAEVISSELDLQALDN